VLLGNAQEGQLPIPKDWDFGVTLPRQFAGHRLHRLTIVPNFIFFSQFFNSLKIIYVLRVKKTIIVITR